MPFIAVFFCFYCKVDGRMVRIQVKVGEGGGLSSVDRLANFVSVIQRFRAILPCVTYSVSRSESKNHELYMFC